MDLPNYMGTTNCHDISQIRSHIHYLNSEIPPEKWEDNLNDLQATPFFLVYLDKEKSFSGTISTKEHKRVPFKGKRDRGRVLMCPKPSIETINQGFPDPVEYKGVVDTSTGTTMISGFLNSNKGLDTFLMVNAEDSLKVGKNSLF